MSHGWIFWPKQIYRHKQIHKYAVWEKVFKGSCEPHYYGLNCFDAFQARHYVLDTESLTDFQTVMSCLVFPQGATCIKYFEVTNLQRIKWRGLTNLLWRITGSLGTICPYPFQSQTKISNRCTPKRLVNTQDILKDLGCSPLLLQWVTVTTYSTSNTSSKKIEIKRM